MFQYAFRDLKADKVFVAFRRIAALRCLKHIKRKFGPAVRDVVVRIRDGIAELQAELRVEQWDRHIRRNTVPAVIGRKMRKRSQGKRVLIQIPGLADHVGDEVAASDVMRQIAVECASKRVVAQVLNDASAIGVPMGLSQFVRV